MQNRGWRAVISAVLVAVLAAGGPLAAEPVAAASSSAAPCPPNSTDTAVGSGERCVAELPRSVRRGTLLGQCAVSPKATLTTNPLYRPLECHGGSGVQAEAIAQARVIGWLNSHAGTHLYGDTPAGAGIAANEQWEVSYAKPPTATTGGRVDVLTYARGNTAGPIELIELKQRRTSSSEQEAVDQLARYSRDLPRGSANRIVQSRGGWQYRDFFRVLVKDCGGTARHRIVNQYDVQLSTQDTGAVLIDMEEQITPCPGDGEPQLPPVPEEQPRTEDVPENREDDPRPPILVPAPGRDSDGDGRDDYWERWLQEHPELDDLPAWPELPVDPVPADATIEIPWATIGIIAVAAATCIAWCASIPAGLAAIGARLAAGAALETGAATVGSALGALGTALAGLIGWNLWGDPHVVTLDRLTYDLQSVGEFHLLEIPAAGIDVQARFRAAGTNVSVLDRIATEVNERRVEVTSTSINVDGEPVPLANPGVHHLGNGAFIARDARGYTVAWPGGAADDRLIMVKNGDRVGFHVPTGPEFGQPRGLLGDNDGNPQNDLALRDGTPLAANPGTTVLHGSFADSWRITDAESFFSYGTGESTASYTDLAAPRNVVTTGDFSAAEVTAATESCAAAGVEPGPQFDGCVLDVLVTGDQRYVESASLVTDVLVSPDSTGVGEDGDLSVDFEGTVPANFAAPNYLQDDVTTRIAGPVFDSNGYRFYVRDLGRHDNATLGLDVLTFGPVATDAHPQSLALTVNRQASGSVIFDDGPPRLSDGLAGSIETVGSGTTNAGLSFIRHRVTLDLGVVGDSLDVSLAPENFHGVLNTSIGFDAIDLHLDVPPAQRFAVDQPFAVPGELPVGAGALETGGAADVYTFAVTAATASEPHVLNPVSCPAKLSFHLVNDDTGAPAGTWANTCGRVQTDPLPAGTYSLTVTRPASAGPTTYGLEVFVLPAPERYAYELGTVAKAGTPGIGAGVLETAASVDVYTLTTTGKDLHLDIRGCFTGLRWTLRSVLTGVDLASGGCADRPLAGLDGGTYEFRVSTQSPAGGSFGFQIFETPVAAQDFDVDWPVTVSDQWPMAGAGHLENQFSIDRYAVTVPAPAPLYVDIQRCLEGDVLDWRVVDASTGAVVDAGACDDRETAELAAGAYRLEVTSASDGIGAYALQAWLTPLAPETFPVTLPAVISEDRPEPGAGNLETKASQDIYTFSVTDDVANAYIDDITCSAPDMLRWQLVTNVSGLDVPVADGGCSDPRVVEHLATGDYRLIVTPIGEHHGTYGMRVVAADPGSPAIVHVPHASAYYGKAIPIDVTTTCRNVEACQVQLVYRTTRVDADQILSVAVNGAHLEVDSLPAGNWTERTLQPTEIGAAGDRALVRWVGEIPASAVTTTGVDYYLVATDGDDRNELPDAGTAPGGVNGLLSDVETAFFHVMTVAPPLLTHVTPGVAQADTDLQLELTATCSTGSCTATLHHRTSAGTPGAEELLGDPGWATITMDASGSTPLGDIGEVTTFTATIPGSEVDTRGVDYYFDVTDSHTTTYWPGTTFVGHYAPRDGMRTGYHTVHVLEPPHIVHDPVPTTPYREATPIDATANCPSTRRCTARLYYRTTTNAGDVVADSVLETHDFESVEMDVEVTGTVNGNDVISLAGEIPASVADTRGIDYFFAVADGSTTTWFPGTGQLQGYVSVDGVRVGYIHTRVLEPPHITPQPQPVTKALQPYTVTSTMTCATESCSMTLYWRNDLTPGETDTGWHAQPMEVQGAPTAGPTGLRYTFTYTIPAEKVTTRGLAYFLEGFDGYVHDYSPGTSYWGAYVPLDGQHVELPVTVQDQTLTIGAYVVRVLEPPHLAHVPQPVAIRNAPLTLTASSNCSSSACPATITWTDSAGVQQATSMTAVRAVEGDLLGDVWQYSATIPGTDTGAPFTYSISVTDGYTSDTTVPVQVQIVDPPPLPLATP